MNDLERIAIGVDSVLMDPRGGYIGPVVPIKVERLHHISCLIGRIGEVASERDFCEDSKQYKQYILQLVYEIDGILNGYWQE